MLGLPSYALSTELNLELIMRYWLILLGIVSGGCTSEVNPSFSLTDSDAQSALRQMRVEPKPLPRPLIVLGGFADIGLGATLLQHKIEPMFDERIRRANCGIYRPCRALRAR
jgi:hypothetical protein